MEQSEDREALCVKRVIWPSPLKWDIEEVLESRSSEDDKALNEDSTTIQVIFGFPIQHLPRQRAQVSLSHQKDR